MVGRVYAFERTAGVLKELILWKFFSPNALKVHSKRRGDQITVSILRLLCCIAVHANLLT